MNYLMNLVLSSSPDHQVGIIGNEEDVEEVGVEVGVEIEGVDGGVVGWMWIDMVFIFSFYNSI